MQVGILQVFLFLSLSSICCVVRCLPNHHHDHNNDFPWQNILSSLGVVIENKTTLISAVSNAISTERSTSESTMELLKSRTTEEIDDKVVAQNGTTYEITTTSSGYSGLGTGYKVGIPIVSIIVFIGYWYCICKCCCACCKDDPPNVVVMQQQTTAVQPQQPAPQIILQQPIIHQQAPPVYDTQQRWGQPPPQWGQQPQGPQWAPMGQMGQQQQYSPNGGYDNAGFNPATVPPPYNPGKY